MREKYKAKNVLDLSNKKTLKLCFKEAEYTFSRAKVSVI